MKRILIIGAGMSSNALIQYVLNHAKREKWNVIVADSNLELAQARVNDHPYGQATWLNVTKANDRRDLIARADLVISLLPAHLHLEVGHDCIKLRKHLITSSYVTQELYRLGDEARNRELLFMGEMGLDPGLQHMATAQMVEELQAKKANIRTLTTYGGGLIVPKVDENPWQYKFTWNPRNVVLAGQGTAQYLEKGKLKYIPYHRLFEDTKTVDVEGVGELEVFANRDALLHKEAYGLNDIQNIYRGTLRYKGFCEAWNALIKLGLTDGNFPILHSGNMTYHEFMDAFTSAEMGNSVKERTANFLNESTNSAVMKKLEWLGLFRKKRINIANATPALILEHLLLKKWQLQEADKDLVVLQQEIQYELKNVRKKRISTLVVQGENHINTAMSKVVGLPVGILARMLLNGKIKSKGVHIPVQKAVYEPVLKELKNYGLVFKEKEVN